ncbi:ABC transporter ATP-binding protein [Rhodospirillum sp. A1_3_36]|uniref:ABC transporter ATP-binding protein n=1 Tax=Rhodospirillum sp. A1_3_36 TaxID=3391666 RepID=UPI0039A66C70
MIRLDTSPTPPSPMGSAKGPSVHLRVDRLTYGGHDLFRDLAIDFPGGAWSCILGPSGVGKSTLLRLAAGLETGGEVGPNTSATLPGGASLAGHFAHMAQSDALLPWLSVLDNCLIGHRLRGKISAGARKRALSLLDDVGLLNRAKDRPGTLSGGMRQRVALVRTLVEDRPVVLMDEPFSALDPPTRLRLGDLAARLLAGRTVLLVTHDPLEALRLGHRVLVLGGRPACPGDPMIPEGPPPRAVDAPTVIAHHAPLLTRLSQALELEDLSPESGKETPA